MKHENSKIRLLAINMFLSTGERLTSTKLQEKLLLRFGITADRKTIYDDIYAINRIIPVDSSPGRNGGFKIVNVLGCCSEEV